MKRAISLEPCLTLSDIEAALDEVVAQFGADVVEQIFLGKIKKAFREKLAGEKE